MVGNKLKLAIPVMLHSDGEVAAYKVAKPRIEEKMKGYGVDTEVGIFAYMTHGATKNPENLQKQLEVQRREQFPIYHVQAPVPWVHSLDVYGRGREEANEKGSLLETAVAHAAALAEFSPVAKPDVDVHQGIYLIPGDERGEIAHSVYGLKYFRDNREKIFDRTKKGFEDLKNFAKNEHDMNIILENEMMATYQPGFGPDLRSQRFLMFSPFAYQDAMEMISKEQTFDIAHFASRRRIENSFRDAGIDHGEFFDLFMLDNWDEFNEAYCNMESYYHEDVKAVHISNTQGIGLHLENEKERMTWGGDGTDDGILTKTEIKDAFAFAQEKGIPAALEVDYDLKNIPVNKFTEADSFIDYVYKK